jgi:predicted GIY-YIG superfamily endonuclease
MITRTIREALLAEEIVITGYVYVVRDGNVVFYVGISRDPIFRLAQHLGIAGRHNYTYPRKQLIQDMEQGKQDTALFVRSQVGDCIRQNAPESLEWSFDIYQKADAIAVVTRAGLTQTFPQVLSMMEIDWYAQRTLVENALIDELHPFLNSQGNEHERTVPARYQHVRAETPSSLALDL